MSKTKNLNFANFCLKFFIAKITVAEFLYEFLFYQRSVAGNEGKCDFTVDSSKTTPEGLDGNDVVLMLDGQSGGSIVGITPAALSSSIVGISPGKIAFKMQH